MTAWKLPLFVAGIAVPIVAGFMLGGGGVGVAVGALTVLVILVIAVRQRPLGPIESASAADDRRRVLLVANCPVEDPQAVGHVAGVLGDGEHGPDPEVLVLAPAHERFLDRWTSDVEPARQAAQENLVATVAALAKAGIDAEARVGDEDVVQAVEDQLQTYPATEVVLVSAATKDSDRRAAAELEERLRPEFRHLVLGPS
jgi:hypothetical protein